MQVANVYSVSVLQQGYHANIASFTPYKKLSEIHLIFLDLIFTNILNAFQSF